MTVIAGTSHIDPTYLALQEALSCDALPGAGGDVRDKDAVH